MNRILRLQKKLTTAQNDTTMTPVLRKQVCAYIVRELERARAEQSVFDYEELIEATRQDAVTKRAQCNCGCGDGNKYDRQWAISLHTFARIAYVWPVMIMFASAAVAAL